MKPGKKTKAQRIVTLEEELEEAKAHHIYRHHFASKSLDKFSTDKLMGSGVVLSLTLVGGKELFEPVMICNGLSKETIAALKADLVRSFNYATEMKPDGA